MIPTIELLFAVNKCNSDGMIEIIKGNNVKCFEGVHFILLVISIIVTLLQLIMIILNSFFNFNPFNANESTSIVNPSNNTLLVLYRFILVVLYVLVNNEWIDIVVMLLGGLLVFKSSLDNPTYNSDILQCLVVIKSCITFYTYLILLLGQLFVSTSFDGLIYFLPIGYILLIFLSYFLYEYTTKNFVEAKADFKNEDEFLNRINYFKSIVDDFINMNKSRSKNNDYNVYKRKEIIIRGQISLHEESCLDEECPLKKFLENQLFELYIFCQFYIC